MYISFTFNNLRNYNQSDKLENNVIMILNLQFIIIADNLLFKIYY